jgi:large subunit ribosomal protein LP2
MSSVPTGGAIAASGAAAAVTDAPAEEVNVEEKKESDDVSIYSHNGE